MRKSPKSKSSPKIMPGSLSKPLIKPTSELVRAVADKVYALLVKDMRIERERRHRFVHW